MRARKNAASTGTAAAVHATSVTTGETWRCEYQRSVFEVLQRSVVATERCPDHVCGDCGVWLESHETIELEGFGYRLAVRGRPIGSSCGAGSLQSEAEYGCLAPKASRRAFRPRKARIRGRNIKLSPCASPLLRNLFSDLGFKPGAAQTSEPEALHGSRTSNMDGVSAAAQGSENTPSRNPRTSVCPFSALSVQTRENADLHAT